MSLDESVSVYRSWCDAFCRECGEQVPAGELEDGLCMNCQPRDETEEAVWCDTK